MNDKQLEKYLSSSDPFVKELAQFYNKITSSSFYNGYVTVASLIEKLNKQIQTSPIDIIGDDKSFPNCHKYITEIDQYYDKLEYFRTKMNPKEVENATVEVKSMLEKVLEEKKK